MYHYIYLIIPPLLLHSYMYYQISCTFGEISFLLYFSNHFYFLKKGHAEIISDMCSLFTFRVYSNMVSFSWKKNQKQIYIIFAIFTTNNYKKIYSIYMYRVLKYSMDCRDTSETALGVLKMIGFVSLMIIMNWM